MLTKTRGIVFRFTRFRETSIIVNIFTDLLGLRSYIVNGVRSHKASGKMALYQPLMLLDLIVYNRENANIERIKEVKCLYPYSTLTSDVRKTSIAMFINEILNKTVKEESHAQEIFDFIFQSLCILDQQQKDYENFHLIFLLKLSRFLGFGARHVNEVLGARVIDEQETVLLAKLLEAEYLTVVPVSHADRRVLLDIILKFYASHIETLGEVKSVQVLREVLA